MSDTIFNFIFMAVGAFFIAQTVKTKTGEFNIIVFIVLFVFAFMFLVVDMKLRDGIK